MRKIYFGGSIRGGREDRWIYLELITHLKKYGEVLTEHISNSDLTSMGDDLPAKEIHDRDIGWLNNSDLSVFEVTRPSLGVGYEVGHAVWKNKTAKDESPILCLYRSQIDRNLSAMIVGAPYVTVREYETVDQARRLIDEFFRPHSR